MRDLENGIVLTLLAVLLVVIAAVVAWSVTRDSMRTDAMANGAGHWVLVDGETAFAWGPKN